MCIVDCNTHPLEQLTELAAYLRQAAALVEDIVLSRRSRL